MRTLVTGAGGFVGEHLVKALLNKGHQVITATRHCDICTISGCKTLYFDIEDQASVHHILSTAKPSAIIHLAAQSKVTVAWEEPSNTLKTNTVGTLNLVEAMAAVCPTAKMLSIGSGEEYGATAKSGNLLAEDMPCFPQNPYAVSKFAAGLTALQFAEKKNLNFIHLRSFNHFGPGQTEGYVVSDFASQIARIEMKQVEPVIHVGDLSAMRDFTFISDIINAYILMLETNCKPGIYNVCSGQPKKISDLLDILVAKSKIKLSVKSDQERFRPSEVPFFAGSSAKLKQVTGWKPIHSFEEGLSKTLDYWRNK